MGLSIYLIKDNSSIIKIWKQNKQRALDQEPDKLRHPIIEQVWNYSYPKLDSDNLFETNMTHNLGKMAIEAGFYNQLWRAPENNIEFANQLINPLKTGIKDMEERPEYYKQFSASNGWGTYEQFIPWLKELLKNCIEYPDAKIETSR